MRFVADENIDSEVIAAMRRSGYEVLAISELAPGVTDDEVLKLSVDRDAILITADKDFGELVYRLGRVSSGVLGLNIRCHELL